MFKISAHKVSHFVSTGLSGYPINHNFSLSYYFYNPHHEINDLSP